MPEDELLVNVENDEGLFAGSNITIIQGDIIVDDVVGKASSR